LRERRAGPRQPHSHFAWAKLPFSTIFNGLLGSSLSFLAIDVRTSWAHDTARRGTKYDSVMTTSTWTVTGMTCAHCVKAVTEEVAAIEGVEDVQVELETGTVTVIAPTGPTREQMAAAVDEAGYALA
jgi:copper chaperone CopZ